eukprot:TRINITY_DN2466_c2_g1_i2.p1 TRINITY_DN2466_c2_g1~~TRINITY_DN2466_c2_g1_i2.p1  ORF type:complete len:521 (-),score=22.60 TRINITY_DN2466_c2_g1_i2:667-2229(-)
MVTFTQIWRNLSNSQPMGRSPVQWTLFSSLCVKKSIFVVCIIVCVCQLIFWIGQNLSYQQLVNQQTFLFQRQSKQETQKQIFAPQRVSQFSKISELHVVNYSKEDVDEINQYDDCFDYAKQKSEIVMKPVFLPGQQIEEGYQWANNNWTQPIQKNQFQSFRGCTLCVRYKIWNGQLFVNSRDRKTVVQKYADFEFNIGPNEEQLLLATYLYSLPNSDFIVTFHATPQTDDSIPVIGPARYKGSRGFTMPHYYHWDTIAMNDEHLRNYQKCIDVKYPRTEGKRIRKAIFRGTSTDPVIKTTTHSTVLDIQRVRLGILGRWHKDILDIGVNLQGPEKITTEVNSILGIRQGPVTPGDHNKYELIISMDGIGYANRVSRHMMDNTPLLIVESRIQEFFRHHMEPEIHYESLKADLSDVMIRVRELLEELNTNRTRLDIQVETMRSLARETFNSTRSLQVTAYSITEYQKFITWDVQWEEEYEPVRHYKDAWYNKFLPKEFTDAVIGAMPSSFKNSPCYKKSCQ